MIERASDSEILKRRIECLLKTAKIKYDSVNARDNFVNIYVTTYKRAKDTVKLMMDKVEVINLLFKKESKRKYWINFVFDFLVISEVKKETTNEEVKETI